MWRFLNLYNELYVPSPPRISGEKRKEEQTFATVDGLLMLARPLIPRAQQLSVQMALHPPNTTVSDPQ